MWIRSGTNHLLDVFDCPDPSTTTPKRLTTTTPLQALGLWNNALVLHLADRFAERLRREAGSAEKPQIELAYGLAFGRLPNRPNCQRPSTLFMSTASKRFAACCSTATNFYISIEPIAPLRHPRDR